ncbi:hypothetical protein [Streptomyces sp. T028]|uniref:nuclear transport factor 2 family protein n=1 Tax=Streptomyces sp. T028 TaxID=3394379 RepID=UPI003A85950A
MNLPMLRRGAAFLGVGILAAAALTAGTTASTDTAVPAPASAPVAVTLHDARASHEAVNKRTAVAFLDLAINQKKPREAADRYLGALYIQHNPRITDGKEAFVAWVEASSRRPQRSGSTSRELSPTAISSCCTAT